MISATVATALSLAVVVATMRRKSAWHAPRLYTYGVFALVFVELLPLAAQIIVTLLLPLAAFMAATRTWARGFVPGSLLLLVALLNVYYLVLVAFHQNVPELSVGLEGIRVGLLALWGLVLGIGIEPPQRRHACQVAVVALAVALVVSIALFVVAPPLEAALVERSAGAETALFAGQRRLQGVFAGPFHVALAAVLVLAATLVSDLFGPWARAMLAVVAIMGLQLSAVRTGLLAALVIALVSVLLSETAAKRLKRLTIAGLVIVGFVYFAINARLEVIESFATIQDDQRLLGRFDDFYAALELVWASPVIGWGPGSAADTLGADFINGVHVTSHNLFLKVLVEGGLIGATLWIVVVVSTMRHMRSRSTTSKIGVLSLVAIGVFGLTGSTVEAVPVSVVGFLLVGFSVASQVVHMDRGSGRECSRQSDGSVPLR